MPTNELDRLTDKALIELEKKIYKLYKQAVKEMAQTIDDYFKRLIERDEQMKTHVEEGTITEKQYTQWRLAQIGRGKRYEDLRDKLAERMTKANEVAVSYVNDTTPGVYTLNMNYTAYSIEKSYGPLDFTVWNEEAVRRLVIEEPNLMPYYPPKRALNRGIDLAYGKTQITAQITSSILLGDSLPKIAEKLRQRIETMSRTSAIRTARTAITAAQNGGRQATFERAAAMGIQTRRRWVATKDMRTRHPHAMADGQVAAVNEPFTVGGEKLMFPGDASLGASGWNLYNCRCGCVSVEKEGIEAEPRMMRVRDPVTGRNVLVKEMTYNEWYKQEAEEYGADKLAIEKKKIVNRSSDEKQWKTYRMVLGKDVPRTFAGFQELKYNNTSTWDTIKQNYKKTKAINDSPCLTTPNKYINYFLKEGTPHADEFFSVGYTKDDPLQLRYDMARQFDINKAVEFTVNERGEERFNIYMDLGITKTRRFRTCWQKDTPDSKPRIITAFRNNE